MPSNIENPTFNSIENDEQSSEALRETKRERGHKIYEIVISELSLRQIVDMDFSAPENETPEQKADRLRKIDEALTRIREEKARRKEVAGTEQTIEAETETEAEIETPTEVDNEESKEIEKAVAEEVEKKAAEEMEKAVQASEANVDNDAEAAAAAVAAVTGTEAAASQVESPVAAAPAAAEATPQTADISSDPTEPLAQPVEVTEDATETTPTSATEATPNLARISPEAAAATMEKAKQKPSLKAILTKKVLPILLAMGLLVPSVAAVVGNANSAADMQQQTPIEHIYSSYDEYAKDHESQEASIGIKDGYGEKGMFLSESKGTPYDFANAGEVGDSIGNHDPRAVILAVGENQVESLADHLANVPDNVKDKYGLSDFKGLSINDTEKKLEGMDNESYEQTLNNYKNAINASFTRATVLNGDYDNSYMQQNGGEAIHQNIDLVRCTTHEEGTPATEFFWLDDDGNEIGSMISKMTEDGGCTQIVNIFGSANHLYSEMPTIETPGVPTPNTPAPETPTPEAPTPDTPTPPEPTPPEPTPPEPTPPEPTPPEQIAPKDPENLIRIDNQINQDIADDIGTDQINITPTESVSQTDLTPQPAAEDYQGTEPTIIQNETSEQATPVQETVSEVNDYSQDLGGANADEYAPVQANEQAQATADAVETPVDQAPTGGEGLEDALNDLGIN